MDFINRLKDLFIVKHPFILVETWEEDRAISYAEKVFKAVFPEGKTFEYFAKGSLRIEEKSEHVGELVKAVEKVFSLKEKAALFVKDPHIFWGKDPVIVRVLKDMYYEAKKVHKFIIFFSSKSLLPYELKRNFEIIEFPFPSKRELKTVLENFIKTFKSKGRNVSLSEKEIEEASIGLQGLSNDEAKRLLNIIFYKKKEIDSKIITEIQEYKKQVILKEGVLEYVPSTWSLSDIGGLDNLKDWLVKRKNAFTEEAQKFGLTPPRGILVMGITGCGKSLSIKTIASLWNLPMFRLDMNLVYSGIAGPPEEAFMRALKTLEAISPAILWIDEIESGITHKQSEGPTSRVLGYFLTWMQEKKADVFVAATANRIDMLPAELLRRGRFDQIFFIDLPTENERAEIFKIHLQKRGNDTSRFDLIQLAKITKGWSGAEIEEAIKSAMYEAFNQKRPLTEDDLFKIFGNTVPLSTTMAEQIKDIRSWAHRRAVRASSEQPEV